MFWDVEHVEPMVRCAQEGHEIFSGLGLFPHADRGGPDFRHTASATCFDALADGGMAFPAFLDGHGDVGVFDGVCRDFDHEFLGDVHLFHFDLDDRPMGLLIVGLLSSEGFGLGGFGRLDLAPFAFCHGGGRGLSNGLWCLNRGKVAFHGIRFCRRACSRGRCGSSGHAGRLRAAAESHPSKAKDTEGTDGGPLRFFDKFAGQKQVTGQHTEEQESHKHADGSHVPQPRLFACPYDADAAHSGVPS